MVCPFLLPVLPRAHPPSHPSFPHSAFILVPGGWTLPLRRGYTLFPRMNPKAAGPGGAHLPGRPAYFRDSRRAGGYACAVNWLPVVNRELRVAARKRSTFWLRIAAALTALVIGGGCMLLSLLQGTLAFGMGSVLFSVLTWLCLAAGLSAGLFFTSDCLSEEKREGTLGLLFLTDLRGYDVTLGKLLATSLRGFYALLAMLPILAVALLMGGVSGAQFWKSALALVNALFFSLAVGMFVSALSRDSQKALIATLFLLLLLALGGPIADTIIGAVKQSGFAPHWSLCSPAYVLTAAGAWGRSAYWVALAVTHLLGWVMLAVASMVVPHTWQERKKAGLRLNRSWAYAWRYGGARRRLRLRRKLIGQQPVAWLVCRERWQALGLWAFALLVTGGSAAGLIWKLPEEAWMIWNGIGGFFTLILYLWAASQACRFLVEARRSGLLELLLSTPLNESQIVAGQWRALLRMFGLPVLLLLGVHVTGVTLSQIEFQRVATRTTRVTSSVVTNQSGSISQSYSVSSGTVVVSGGARTNTASPRPGFQAVNRDLRRTDVAVTIALVSVVSVAANLVALCWFALWMGLTTRSANLATLKTLLFAEVIPWFVIAFGASIVAGLVMSGMFIRGAVRGGSPPSTFLLWYTLLSAVLTAAAALAKDIGFIVWSRKRLHSSFREEAARSIGQPRFAVPLPVPAAAPPVIAAPQ